jgi:hypothetical protein
VTERNDSGLVAKIRGADRGPMLQPIYQGGLGAGVSSVSWKQGCLADERRIAAGEILSAAARRVGSAQAKLIGGPTR